MRWTVRLTLLLAVCVLWFATERAFAQGGKVELSLLSRWSGHLSGNVWAVAAQSNLVFVVSGGNAMEVLGVDTSTVPEWLGRWDGGDQYEYIRHVAVNGNFAYLTDIYTNLLVLDVTNPGRVVQAGKYATCGDVNGLVVMGNYAYLAAGTNGLQVIDVADPTRLSLVGSRATAGMAYGVAVRGNYVYVADGTNGLQVFNVTDAVNPSLVGGCATPGTASGVAVSGNYAYVAANENGLQIVNVTDPTHPALVGGSDTSGVASRVAVMGNYAYVTDGDGWGGPWGDGLVVFDVSDPTHPKKVGGYETLSGDVADVVCDGRHIFVANFDRGVHVFDVGNPALQGWGGAHDLGLGGFETVVAVRGSYAYVGDLSTFFYVVDVSNPVQLVRMGACAAVGVPSAILLSENGDYAYVADDLSGLKVIDIRDPARPVIVASDSALDGIRPLALAGDYAYAADALMSTGLRVLDLSDPIHPISVGHLEIAGNLSAVAVSGNYAYVAAGDDDWGNQGEGLVVVDISNPAQPVRVGAVNPSGSVNGVAVTGNYAYVANYGNDFTSGVYSYDVSNPKNPTLMGAIVLSGRPSGLKTSGNYACTMADGGVELIDLSAPGWPKSLGNFKTPDNVVAMAIGGSYAYCIDGAGLRIVDIRRASHIDKAGAVLAVGVSGNHAFLADREAGMQVIDMSSPEAPVRVARLATGGECRSLTLVGTYAYLACVKAGLQVVDISNPAIPLRLVTHLPRNEFDQRQDVWGVAVDGNRAYVVDASGLDILDVTNPAVPVRLGRYATGGYPESVVVAGGLVYVADRNLGLLIVDVGDAANPTLKGSLRMSYANEVVIAGSYAYVADGSGGMRVVDVTNPTNPILVRTWNTTSGNCWAVAVTGDHAYVGDDMDGVAVLDISNPASPLEVGRYAPGGYVYGFALASDSLFVADEYLGLVVLKTRETGIPVITQQPQSQTVSEGGSASFAVAATGAPPLSYQWRRNGTDILGSTNSSLALSSLRIEQAGTYSILVSNAKGSVLSHEATLTVRAMPHFITSQPQPRSVAAGSTATFSVSTSPGLYRFQWIQVVSSNLRPVPWGTNATLTLRNVTSADAGLYFCQVEEVQLGLGTEISFVVPLLVTMPPVITRDPVSQSVTVGGSVTFTVGVTGDSPLTYQWRRNGVAITGATNDTLVLDGVTVLRAGTYTAKVTNAGGSVTSLGAVLTVLVPNTAPVLAAMADQAIDTLQAWSLQSSATDTDVPAQTLTFGLVSGPEGLSVSPAGMIAWTPSAAQAPSTNLVVVKVTDSGVPARSATNQFTVVVRLANTPPSFVLVGTQKVQATVPWSIQLVAGDAETPSAQLVFSLVSAPEGVRITPSGLISWVPSSGQAPSTNTVSVRVSDAGTPPLSATNQFTIVVFELGSDPRLPRIDLAPQGIDIVEGENGYLYSVASGTAPLSYYWRKDGQAVTGSVEPVLALTNAIAAMAGNYTLEVSNQFGSALSAPATVRIVRGPEISSAPQNTTVFLGGRLTLTVGASGTGPVVCQWRHNGMPIPNATNLVLEISPVTVGDGGTYSAVMANPWGVVETTPALVTIAEVGSLFLSDTYELRPVYTSIQQLGWTNNFNATAQTDEPLHAGRVGGKSLWMGWVAPAHGLVSFHTTGSSFDTLLAVYGAGPWAGIGSAVVAADEDRGGYLTSEVTFMAEAGQEYAIAVDGFAGGSGTVVLGWTFAPTTQSLPVIVSQSSSQVVLEGASVILEVQAAGDGLTYQWQRGGQSLTGANSPQLNLGQVTTNMAGIYRVGVTNSGGLGVVSADIVIEVALGSAGLGPVSQDKWQDLFPAQAVRPQNAGGNGYIGLALGEAGARDQNAASFYGQGNEASLCEAAGEAGRWLRLRAESDGELVVDTGGSTVVDSEGNPLSVLLGVYEHRSGNDLISLGCDSRGGDQSAVVVAVTKGQDLVVQLNVAAGAKGTVRVNWNLAAVAQEYRVRGIKDGWFHVVEPVLGGVWRVESGDNLEQWKTIRETNVHSGLLQYKERFNSAISNRIMRIVQPGH